MGQILRGRLVAATALSFLCSSGASGQMVYKSVDAQGNVTYSSSPPPDGRHFVERVPIDPPLPESQRRAAEDRLEQLRSEMTAAGQARQERVESREEAVSAANRELQRVRSELDETRIQDADDWQYLSRGGRVLSQDYLDRVEQAEQRVQEAEETLREAHGGRP